jgi:hypothetical protein
LARTVGRLCAFTRLTSCYGSPTAPPPTECFMTHCCRAPASFSSSSGGDGRLALSPLHYATRFYYPSPTFPLMPGRWTRRRQCWGRPASSLRPHRARSTAWTCRASWSLTRPCIRSSFLSRWVAPYWSRSSRSWNASHLSSSGQVRSLIQSVTPCSSGCSF